MNASMSWMELTALRRELRLFDANIPGIASDPRHHSILDTTRDSLR